MPPLVSSSSSSSSSPTNKKESNNSNLIDNKNDKKKKKNSFSSSSSTGMSSSTPAPAPAATIAATPNNKSKKLVYGSDDKLFGCIERNQALSGKSFGKFLDAGTGSHSLRWIASLIVGGGSDSGSGSDGNHTFLKIDEYTAITADEGMRQTVFKEAQELGIEKYGQILIGNWQSNTSSSSLQNTQQSQPPQQHELCHGEMYDTILADYLVGAMDGFSPYYQDQIFPRLNQHLKPGGTIHVIGLNPIPHNDNTTSNANANIICKVARVRDACILLAGHRCYREYPIEWIERHLERVPGWKVVSSSRFPIMYSHAAIVRQLNVARSKLSLFPSKALAKEMEGVINDLERESREVIARSPNGRIRYGFDYVVTAEKSLEVDG